MSDRLSRRFRASFPSVSVSVGSISLKEPGFRTSAWRAPLGLGEAIKLLAPTTVDALLHAATEAKVGVRFYPDDEKAPPVWASYAELVERVKAAAGALRKLGVARGDRVLIVLPTSIEFLSTFFAAQWLGAIPVPSYPPAALEKVETAIDRLVHIGNHSRSTLLVTTSSLRLVLGDVARRVKSLRGVAPVEDLEGGAPVEKPEPLGADDPCFIQYTSGSTGNPKGVLLTHRNITNCVLHVIGVGLVVGRKDNVVSWLPLYHDMGLIGGTLACRSTGASRSR